MINVENLTKYYGKLLAVDDISFTVGKGEVVGFLGANGAGKSTTMKMITGYLMPNAGKITLGDIDISKNPLEARRMIGYLPENVPLYMDMTVRSYLTFAAQLRGIEKKEADARVNVTAERCGLETYIDTGISKLSKGYKQRVGIAQAIIHDPPVLIMDEPTIGIDPIQLAQVRSLVKDLGKERTILLSTHDLSEASMICERVIIIRKGKIIAKDTVGNLSARISESMALKLNVKGPADQVVKALSKIKAVDRVVQDKDMIIVEYGVGHEPQTEIVAEIMKNGWTLLTMEAVEKSLEDIFLNLASGKDA